MKSLGLCLLILVLSCRKDYNDNPLAQILESNHPAIRTVMDQLETHELQIKVSKLITYNNNDLRLSTYNFQVADSNYFYPASTVKFPIAILALEKANSIKEINSDTPFIVEGDSIFTTIKENVNAIFAVSDNAAYNRLYEFLGRDYIHTKLREKGLQPAQIVHRLESDDAENSTRKAIIFKLSNALQYIQPADMDSEIEPLKLHRLKKGKGYYKNDELIKKPMDFSKKNYLPISTLHDIMKRIQYPNAFNKEEQFTLSNEDYEFYGKP